MRPLHLIKTTGYATSSVSVLLLGAVSWKSAHSDPVMSLLLAAGMATSILGMGCRWFTYQKSEEREKRETS